MNKLYTTLNARILAIALFMVVGVSSAWAGGSAYYWSKVAALTYPSGAGQVYISGEETADSLRDYKESYIWTECKSASYNESYGITSHYIYPYFYAKSTSELAFVGWKKLKADYWIDLSEDPTIDVADYLEDEIATTESMFYDGDVVTTIHSTDNTEDLYPETPLVSYVAIFGHVKLENVPGQSELGTMSIEDPMVEIGDFTTITATPADGATFEYWIDDAGNKYTDNPLEITVHNNITYRPVFSHPDYQMYDFGTGSWKLISSPSDKDISYDYGTLKHVYLTPRVDASITYNDGTEKVSYIDSVEVDTTINGVDTVVIVPTEKEKTLNTYAVYPMTNYEESFPGGPYATDVNTSYYGTRTGDAVLVYGEGLVSVKYDSNANSKVESNYLVGTCNDTIDIATLPSGYKYYTYDEATKTFNVATSGIIPPYSGYLALPETHKATKYDVINFVSSSDYPEEYKEDDNAGLLVNGDFTNNYYGWDFKSTGAAWSTIESHEKSVVEAYAGWSSLDMIKYSAKQNVTLPAGTYKLSAYGFYREGNKYDVDPTVSHAKLFAGSDSIDFVTLGSVKLDSYADSKSQASAAFNEGLYLNELTFTVSTDTTITVGVAGTHDVMRSWFILGPVSLENINPESHLTEMNINYRRYVNQGYTADNVEYDEAAVLSALGISSLSEARTAVINVTTGEYITDYATYDGWLNSDGDVTTWGNGSYVCLKYPHDGAMALCTMPTNEPALGTSYIAKYAILTDADTVVLNVNIKFTEPAKPDVTLNGSVYKTSVSYTAEEGNYAEKTVSLSDEDVAAICKELGLSSLTEATVYGYNPTSKEFLSSYASYDGWRDASGDFHTWTGGTDVPVCVKYTDGQNYLCYNIQGTTPGDYKAYWVIANTTNSAVLVEITFTYEEATGINNVATTSKKASMVYNVNGQKLNSVQKGLNIVDGKKILVK